MKKTLVTSALFFLLTVAFGQQLYLDVFTGYNRTAYEPDFYSEKKPYLTAGARMAAGTDHIQLGGEVRTNLTDPSFDFINRSEEHHETYIGGFVRTKIAKYPAMRFGLVLRAGAGVHNIETRYKDFGATVKYDPVLGFNGGVGFSIPATRAVMLELGYTYNYVNRPEISGQGLIVQEFNSSFHSFQAGLSLNFVFGKRAAEYRMLRETSRRRS